MVARSPAHGSVRHADDNNLLHAACNRAIITRMDPKQTRSYQLIEARLGQPLAEHVASRRETGVSWEQIARELDKTTGVPISGQAVRTWFGSKTKAEK
jgi:hypothetical protein